VAAVAEPTGVPDLDTLTPAERRDLTRREFTAAAAKSGWYAWAAVQTRPDPAICSVELAFVRRAEPVLFRPHVGKGIVRFEARVRPDWLERVWRPGLHAVRVAHGPDNAAHAGSVYLVLDAEECPLMTPPGGDTTYTLLVATSFEEEAQFYAVSLGGVFGVSRISTVAALARAVKVWEDSLGVR
jgi:hypothetical protein